MKKKYLEKDFEKKEALEFIVVAEKNSFELVSRNTKELLWMSIPYNEFDFPMLKDVESIEKEILKKIHTEFPESKEKAIELIYFDEYEERIQKIVFKNKLEFR